VLDSAEMYTGVLKVAECWKRNTAESFATGMSLLSEGLFSAAVREAFGLKH